MGKKKKDFYSTALCSENNELLHDKDSLKWELNCIFRGRLDSGLKKLGEIISTNGPHIQPVAECFYPGPSKHFLVPIYPLSIRKVNPNNSIIPC